MQIVGLLAVIAIVLILAAFDVFWPFTVALVLGSIAVWWWGHSADVIAMLRPEFVALYVLVGFAWVFFKWTRLVEKAWRDDRRSGPPKWAQHSYDFAAYFFYWPIDMVIYVLSDLVRDAWEFISTMVGRSFDRYATWRFREGRGVGR